MNKYNKLVRLILMTGIIFSFSMQNTGAQVAYRITEKDLIPEGITYSSTTNSFYITSIYKSKIVQIDAETGEFKDFVTPDLIDMRYLGMITDENRKHLWACAYNNENGKHFATVAQFDLTSGKLLKSHLYTDTVANIYNDLVQDKEGNVFFTNTSRQTIYRIDQKKKSVSIFFDGIQIEHPNGITISPDYKYLYVASTERGIRVLDIKKRKVINEPDKRFDSTGLDGLKFYRNSLIGLQNEVKSRSEVKICRFFLDEKGTKITSMKIIDQNNPNFDIPTTFVIVSDFLYCLANSQMGNINFTNHKIRSVEALDDVLILKYKLK